MSLDTEYVIRRTRVAGRSWTDSCDQGVATRFVRNTSVPHPRHPEVIPEAGHPEDLPHPSRLQRLGRRRDAGGLRAALHAAAAFASGASSASRTPRFGATSFLALEAIGGTIALNYGFTNALWAILVVGLITFLTGLPISYYAARYGVDMDLLTRGAGFGYLGSTHHLAGLRELHLHLLRAGGGDHGAGAADGPRLAAVAVLPDRCRSVVIPLVMHGITLISRLQAWTQPIWIVLLLLPYAWRSPSQGAGGLRDQFTSLARHASRAAARFRSADVRRGRDGGVLARGADRRAGRLPAVPARDAREANRGRWWTAVMVAGPGWVVPGMLKMVGGAFLAFLVAAARASAPSEPLEPTADVPGRLRATSSDDPAWVAVRSRSCS